MSTQQLLHSRQEPIQRVWGLLLINGCHQPHGHCSAGLRAMGEARRGGCTLAGLLWGACAAAAPGSSMAGLGTAHLATLTQHQMHTRGRKMLLCCQCHRQPSSTPVSPEELRPPMWADSVSDPPHGDTVLGSHCSAVCFPPSLQGNYLKPKDSFGLCDRVSLSHW